MATVYGIVTQHPGLTTVSSAPGQGTRFTVDLPRVDAAEEAVARTPTLAVQVPRGPETILVVEDDLAVGQLLRQVLERRGYRVAAPLAPLRGPGVG